MTIRVLSDVEEAISREIRRITFFEDRSPSHTVLKEMFDPLTGDMVSIPIEPDFYDSSADSKAIHYPHFFVKLLRIREDRTTGRIIPQYGKSEYCPITVSPKAYEIVLYLTAGEITSPGNTIITTTTKIRKIEPGFLIRILSGTNIGTYTVDSITPSSTGEHEILVSNILVNNLPNLLFDTATRVVNFEEAIDLSTIKINDVLTDSTNTTFNIININLDNNSIEIDGIGTPSLMSGGFINRTGDVLQTDLSSINFIIMDPSKPVTSSSGSQIYTSYKTYDPAIPLDLFYQVKIDSNERDDHIAIATRMWEEFNPPRTGLPTIVRSSNSVEQLITEDITIGGSNTLVVQDNSNFKVNDPVFIFNDLIPTKDQYGKGFQEIFSAKVIGLVGTTNIILDKIVPDTFTTYDNTKIVSNAQYLIYMFHMEDHITRDIEGSQYWSHEFTFWIQVWIDRQGDAVVYDDVVHTISLNDGILIGPTILEN